MKVCKEGVEFQFASKRIESLKTRVTMYGAWIKTIYNSDSPQYKASSILLDNKQLKYVGLYNGDNGTESQAFNTNFMFDSYIAFGTYFLYVGTMHLVYQQTELVE